MAVNFRELLSVKADDVKAPVPLPEGTFHGVISSFEYGDNNKNKTPYVRLHLKFTHPGEDVDPSQMEGIDLSTKKLSRDFYLTPDALFRLKDLLESCGISTEGRTLDELIPELANAQVKVYIQQRMNPDKPNDPPRNDIRSVTGDA